MELIKNDLVRIEALFTILEQMTSVSDLERIEIHCDFAGQRWIVGYGESGEPALLQVIDLVELERQMKMKPEVIQ